MIWSYIGALLISFSSLALKARGVSIRMLKWLFEARLPLRTFRNHSTHTKIKNKNSGSKID